MGSVTPGKLGTQMHSARRAGVRAGHEDFSGGHWWGLFTLVAILCLTPSCKPEESTDPNALNLGVSLPGDGVPIRNTTCVFAPVRPHRANVLAFVEWPYKTEWRNELASSGLDWRSERFVQILDLEKGFLVLNSDLERSVLLDTNFRFSDLWNPKVNPGGTVRAGSVGGHENLWVLANPPGRASEYRFSGEYLRSIEVGETADILWLRNNGILVSTGLDGPLSLTGSGPAVHDVVYRLSEETGKKEPFIRLESDKVNWPRVSVPIGRVPIRVTGNENRVAVSYPWSGIVDVYSGEGEQVASVHTCIPEDVAEAIKGQLELGVRKGQFSDPIFRWFGVETLLSEDGSISILGGVPTVEGEHHISRYNRDGVFLETWVFRAPLPPDQGRLGFLGSAARLYAFTAGEGMVVFELEPVR